jgi:hypothetical protein
VHIHRGDGVVESAQRIRHGGARNRAVTVAL